MDILKKHFFTTPNKPLYHYTTLKGFLGIINDGEIWATHIFYTNDQTELNRSIKLLNDELEPRIDTLKNKYYDLGPKAIGPETNPDVLKMQDKLNFFEGIRNIISDVVNDNRIQFYVCSFTELDDSLSQWRGYCQDGNGISIGFDFTTFKSRLNLRNCIYDENLQKRMLKELVDWWFNRFNSINDKDSESDIMLQCIKSFFKVAPFFKHPKYEEEAEWRIVIGGEEEILREKIKIVDSAYTLKPYCCLKLDLLPQIKQIWIGPSPHISLNKLSVQQYLKSKLKYFSPELVLESEIPYRGRV